MSRSPISSIRRFRGEDGSVTVESVLWLPAFLFIFCLIADASMLFHNQARATRIVQDANRFLSIGRLENETETMDFIRNQLAPVTVNAAVATRIVDDMIETVVRIPSGDLDIIGFATALTSIDVEIRGFHLIES